MTFVGDLRRTPMYSRPQTRCSGKMGSIGVDPGFARQRSGVNVISSGSSSNVPSSHPLLSTLQGVAAADTCAYPHFTAENVPNKVAFTF
jgi:hypothetical protein